jgi:serine protease AprX
MPAIAVSATPGQILSLLDDPAIDRIWYDVPVHVCLDYTVPLVQAPRLWNYDYTGRGVRVAVLDTGIDLTHPDLMGRIVETAVFAGDDVVTDRHGHGTHVAGIIAGSGSFSQGRYTGMAPAALLLIGKVLGDDGTGWSSDVMAGIDWAVWHRAQVINLSLSSEHYGDGSDALSLFCDAAVQQGVVVCVAAGNNGPDPLTIGAPGCARQVITAGASTDADGLAEFSARGPTADGRIKPDLVFPGTLITAARARGTHMGATHGDYYTEASGTSMATAHCTGAAALLLSANPNLQAVEVKAQLLSGAKELGRNPHLQGAGRGDVYAAYRTTQAEPVTAPRTEYGPFDAASDVPVTAASAETAARDETGVVARGMVWAGIALGGLVLCVCLLLGMLFGLDAVTRALETSGATPTPTPALSLVLRQDFDVPDPAWPQEENASEQKGYVEGRYYLVAREPNSMARQALPGTYGNFVLEMSAGQVDGPLGGAYGLILRQRDSGNFYYFGLSSDGLFSFTRVAGGQVQEIIPWTPSDAILKLGYLNRVRVEARDELFTFTVNGETLATVEDATFADGETLLFAASFDEGGVRADFDEVGVWSMEYGVGSR